MKKMDNDELNEYLETTCVRCDKGICDCSDCSEQLQELQPIALVVDDYFVDNLNDWE